jgi:hypothetical protein
MSEDEELLAGGRLLKEYRDLSTRLVALRAHGRNMAAVINAFYSDLQDESYGGNREVKVDGDIVTVKHSKWTGQSQQPDASGKWPTLSEVTAHVNEIKTTKARLSELGKELKALGIPIDDKNVR